MERQGLDPSSLPIFRDMPELEEWLRPVWDIFHALNGSRQYGFGSAQPIQLQEILAAFSLFGVEHEDTREEYLSLIQHMDRIFLEVQATQRTKPKK